MMNGTGSSLRWYLIHCKPRQDERALENLERQGFHCYRPLRYSERWRAGRKRMVTHALFPGYVFIQLDRVNDNWYPIRSTRGVNQLVCCNNYPLPIADRIVEGIRARLIGTVPIEQRLRSGNRVQITEGAFSQLEAIFIARDGEERVVLLLNIMQTEQQLIFPMQSVRKIE